MQLGSKAIGEIDDFAGSAAPAGCLLCDGTAVSRSTYWKLFSVIGTVFGAGDGTTTFNVPDLRGRVGVGADNMGGTDAGRLSSANTLNTSGGAETFALAEANLPAHAHSMSLTLTRSTMTIRRPRFRSSSPVTVASSTTRRSEGRKT